MKRKSLPNLFQISNFLESSEDAMSLLLLSKKTNIECTQKDFNGFRNILFPVYSMPSKATNYAKFIAPKPSLLKEKDVSESLIKLFPSLLTIDISSTELLLENFQKFSKSHQCELRGMTSLRRDRDIFFKSSSLPQCDTTIFLVHGACGGIHQLDSVYKKLSKTYNCVIFDAVGVGRSRVLKEEKEYATKEFVEDIDVLIKKFGTAKNVLVGDSYGVALVISYMSTMYSKKKNVEKEVTGIVLLGGGIMFKENIFVKMVKFLPPCVMKMMMKVGEKGYRKKFFSPDCPSWIAISHTKIMQTRDMKMFRGLSKNLKWITKEDCLKVNVPTLIIHGDKDQIFKVSNARKLHETIKESKFEVINKCGHFVSCERPHDVVTKISKFLSK